jgi:two-component system chemotaxis response regulator CheY
VLVVNDDACLAASVRGLLDEAGYDTSVVSDGSEGLAVLARSGADLMLLDLIMPRLDGWGFLQQFATQAAGARPAVLVWSVADDEGLERARMLGAAACLQLASTDPDQLLDAMARLLGSRNSRCQGPRAGQIRATARRSAGLTPARTKVTPVVTSGRQRPDRVSAASETRQRKLSCDDRQSATAAAMVQPPAG